MDVSSVSSTVRPPLLGNERTATQRFENINYSDLATSEAPKAKRYKIAAYTAMAVGLAVFVGAVAVTAILIPIPATAVIAAAFVFAFGLILYNSLVKNKIFTHFRNLQSQAEGNALKYQGYAEQVAKVKNASTPAMRNMMGLRNYWVEASEKTKKEISDIDSQLRGRVKQEDTSALIEKRHHLYEGTYLSTKVHAAYFQYLIDNPTETREEDALVTFQLISRYESDTYQRRVFICSQQMLPAPVEPSYIRMTNSPDLPFSRKEIESMPIKRLALEIFGRQKAA